MKTWTLDPHSGGLPIPVTVKRKTIERLQRHAVSNYKGLYTRIDIRFRGPLCYMDAYTEPTEPDAALLRITHESREQFLQRLRKDPKHLGRIRYFGDDRWSYAFYTYSRDRYEPAVFLNGEWFGTPEDAFDIGATYLQDK